jgi:hypothetical protein
VVPGTGKVSRVADVSATQRHAVPTVVAQLHGNLYLSFLGTFPVTPHSQRVLKVARSGDVDVVARGFTAVLGLDFDDQGRMYALDGSRELVVNHLFFPTAMRFGLDGALYISNKGFGPPQLGEILRVSLPGVTSSSAVAAR